MDAGIDKSGIHPAPQAFSAEQLTANPILHFFHFAHLPAKLQASSRPFCKLAQHIVETLPRNAERSVALRKLLEAKDAAVRANVGSVAEKPRTPRQAIGDAEDPVVREVGGHDMDRDGIIPFSG